MKHKDTCNCRDCRLKRVDEVELTGESPVYDFLRILAKVAKRPAKEPEGGGNGHGE